jgi:hypothetical protein
VASIPWDPLARISWGFKLVHGPHFLGEFQGGLCLCGSYFMGGSRGSVASIVHDRFGGPWPVFDGGLKGVCGPYFMGCSRRSKAHSHGGSRGPSPIFHGGF